MKIVSLHIYHFGGLRDCKISFEQSGLQLLFGENEAGKTTLMDFMKCMLYGFPAKNQSERRYEPKNGNRMGGKMTIQHKKYGRWTIERIAGTKVTGDVTLYDETGQQKGESFLFQLLNGMDHSLFAGAFCFGIDGLQKLDKLTSEELGNFLISTAISGDRDLLEIEQNLEKKQSLLFKKAGKKPIINEKLEQLKAIGKSLETLKGKNESYLAVKAQKENLEKHLKKTKENLASIQKELRSNKRLFELKPVLEKFKQLEIELSSFGSMNKNFPENGIQRYEQWVKEGSLLKGELDYIHDRLRSAEKEQKSLIPDTSLIDKQNEIKQLFNKLPYYKHLYNQLLDLKKNVESIEKEEANLFESIGETWTESDLKNLSLSLSSLHELEDLIKQSFHVKDKKRRLEDELEDSRMKLERLEKEEAEQKGLLLSNEELEQFQQQNTTKQINKLPFYSAVIPLLSAVVLIWSGWSSSNSSVMYSGIFLITISVVLASIYTKKGKSDEKIPSPAHHRLLEDEMNRKQWMQISAQLSNENNIYLQLAKQLDYIEVEEAAIFESAEKWGIQNGYRGNSAKLFVSGYMKRLFELKELLKQKEALNDKIQKVNDEKTAYENEASLLTSFVEYQGHRDTKGLVVSCHSRLEEQLKNRAEVERLTRSCKEFLERKGSLQKKFDFINVQIRKLWDEAGVSQELDYYQRGRSAEHLIKLHEERETFYNQLKTLGFSTHEIDEMTEKVTVGYDDTVQAAEELEKKEEDAQREYAEAVEGKGKLEWELNKLLEDGSYSEHLHRYEWLKEEWNGLVKKWATFRLAQHALQKVKENYQKTKLPAVLETSSVYFSKITESEYQSILFTDTNELMAVKEDGTRFYPHELSRGTAEQVYLSIRLAVAKHAGPADFPILMDDIAVNFDEKRTRCTLLLIQEAAQERQILFFTCHKHVASLVPSVPLIHWPSRSVLAEM
ncbi:ATP-binding protein [Fictibacillus barbaricus]|uniref:AAA family ATPase n=1 Tax=Fictibacillus barbaricus TaxID=182136 RepID=A0ABS2ZB14_9BACL|nr:AAA family ATPase [Fictibacillus barbaricus]MBN3544528.1 AAA family ATPase [Fictibacillus barbaricus]GGB65997.1 hypothetical protein GCM10007199_35340 [Fictibacillus barbaricus]